MNGKVLDQSHCESNNPLIVYEKGGTPHDYLALIHVEASNTYKEMSVLPVGSRVYVKTYLSSHISPESKNSR